MKIIQSCLIIVGIGFTIHSYADTPYQRCTDEQTQQIMQQFKFYQLNKFQHDAFTSCLNIDSATQLIAISNPITELSDQDDGDFDLHLFLVDLNKNKILQSIKSNETITSDADLFDGITLDVNRFSTLVNTDVVALRIDHSHRGGFTYSSDDLTLYKIGRNQPIQKILSGIGTHESGYEAIGPCEENNQRSNVKRIFVLSQNVHHGLQDIILKESKDQVRSDYRKCTSIEKHYKQQQILKFNGKYYQFEHRNFLGMDPF